MITLRSPLFRISSGWPISDCRTILKVSPSADVNSLIFSDDILGLQSRAPLILTAATGEVEIAKNNIEAMKK